MNVQYTVREIVKFFFKDEKKSIIYRCSFEDQKEIQRFHKFSRWFINDDFNKCLIKMDGIIKKEYNYYTSFIYHKNNVNSVFIEALFMNTVKEYNEK
ncbi:DUF6169 family protein [Capnocytophaga sp. ARDL2]|uniref:DUF6169 family protein n=1 Tax=Capnocytophaga sp. ARDL2 TaxID=3238809 RepID=UPI00355897C7